MRMLFDFVFAPGEVSDSVEGSDVYISIPKTKLTSKPESVYSFDVLNVFSHAHDMRERKVLNDNEW